MKVKEKAANFVVMMTHVNAAIRGKQASFDFGFRNADFGFSAGQEHIWLIHVSNAEWAVLMHLKEHKIRNPHSEIRNPNLS